MFKRMIEIQKAKSGISGQAPEMRSEKPKAKKY